MKNLTLLEIDHHLEKMEFALAISRSIGDKKKSAKIMEQIQSIGFKYEEPGT